MTNTRRERKARAGAEKSLLPEPTHFSTLGNPFPPGMPIHVKPAPFQHKENRAKFSHCQYEGPEPVCEPDFPVDPAGYLYEPPAADLPPFKPRFPPRDADQTDAQYAASRRAHEHNLHVYSIFRMMVRRLCDYFGNHRRCARPACRRRGRCSTPRDEDTSYIGYAVYPLCVPYDIEIMENFRQEVAVQIKLAYAAYEAAGAYDADPARQPQGIRRRRGVA